ncbi:protocatechuate 3,4-dioxygenase subunit alpha [Pseudonocardia sp. HH130630-07]|uniref:protocatechuate 3,4-dioxygenase subunit alpha n=1 Tax=Pseudonocardia sp. HH130630-07 TaxID=1690815 RepID=UPI000814BE17|nr:protocatechuate 3,4-dioxygenase subunit alpha [Pseudonocardia sp. HH130630-07]ANY07947.1 protocatechuate 3,4-dioxygenase subunit alpha [Pseudonocardia sp. HH130630-07]
MSAGLTPSQTVGPYLSLGLPWADGPDVVAEGTPGAVTVGGTVFDGAGAPVPDALIETWQADPDGRFDHPDDPRGAVPPAVAGFRGFGRVPTDGDGHWAVRTLLPGAVPALGEGRDEAPHIDVSVFARGLLDRVVTRIYFPQFTAANAVDPLLAEVPAARRDTLLARADGAGRYRFDIRLQGPGETVFLRI